MTFDPTYSLDDVAADSARLRQRLALANRATDLPASARFDIARSDLSDSQLLEVTATFGRDTNSAGWGLAPVLGHLLSREEWNSKIPVADLAQFQRNLRRQGYVDRNAQTDGAWGPEWNTAAYRFDQDVREQMMGGSSWAATTVRSGLELMAATIPSKVFQAIVGGAKGFMEQTPETVGRVGAAGGAVGGGILGGAAAVGAAAATGAALGSAAAPFTLGGSILVGAGVGAAVGFLADLFSKDDDDPADASLADGFRGVLDALFPEEYSKPGLGGVKQFWEDLGWTLTAAGAISGAGSLAGGVKAVGAGIEAGIVAQSGSVPAVQAMQAAMGGRIQPGYFSKFLDWASRSATGAEFSPQVIQSAKAIQTVGSKLVTGPTIAGVTARYAGGIGFGDESSTIEKAVAEGPEISPWVDLVSFLAVPSQIFPVKLSALTKAAAFKAESQTALQPVVGAIQQTEKIGTAEARAKALEYLGANEAERAANYAHLLFEAGLDTAARKRLIAHGIEGGEGFVENAFFSARNDILNGLRDEAGNLASEKVAEVVGAVTGNNRAEFQGWLTRHMGDRSMGDFMQALELSEDVTAQIRSGALGVEIPTGSLRNTAKAWQRITMNVQRHDLNELAASLKARAEKSTNVEEIAQLKIQIREAEAQAVQLRADLPKTSAGLRTNETIRIIPAKKSTATVSDIRARIDAMEDIQARLKESTAAEEEALKRLPEGITIEQATQATGSFTGAQAHWKLKLDEMRNSLIDEGLITWKQETPKAIVSHLKERAKYASADVPLPAEQLAAFDALGYKPVAISANEFLHPGEAKKMLATIGLGGKAPQYSKFASFIETVGLSPWKQNDEAIFNLMKGNVRSEIRQTVADIATPTAGLPTELRLSADEVMGRLQSALSKSEGSGVALGGAKVGRAPLTDIRQLSPQQIFEAFETVPHFGMNEAQKIHQAIKRGYAWGTQMEFKHPVDAARAIGRAMRVNSLPGFSDVVRGYALPAGGKFNWKYFAGGAATGAVTGAVVGDEEIADAIKGAAAGGASALALAMAAFAKNGYGYLPDRLARLHNALRYTLSPTFDAGRYLEQNIMAKAKADLPFMLNGERWTKARYGEDGWREALSLWDELTGGVITNIDSLEQRMSQVGILAYNPQKIEAARAYQLMRRGVPKKQILETVASFERYGLGRTGLEKSVNFVMFPFSYAKKFYSAGLDFILQEPGRALILHEAMRQYYLSKFDEKLHSLIEDHLPIVDALRNVSNLAYGISPGRFFLEGLVDNKSGLGKATQALSSFFVPSGAAQPLARVAGEAGDLAMHLFVPVIATGADIKRIGGVEALEDTVTRYVPLFRDIFGPYGVIENAKDQATSLVEGESKYSQLRDYQDGVRGFKQDLEPVAIAMGYASVDGLLSANPVFANAYQQKVLELGDEFPTGQKLSAEFTNTAQLDKQALHDLSVKSNRSKAEDAILGLAEIAGGASTLKDAGLPSDVVDAMVAQNVRARAREFLRDRQFIALWDRFMAREFGPLVISSAA